PPAFSSLPTSARPARTRWAAGPGCTAHHWDAPRSRRRSCWEYPSSDLAFRELLAPRIDLGATPFVFRCGLLRQHTDAGWPEPRERRFPRHWWRSPAGVTLRRPSTVRSPEPKGDPSSGTCEQLYYGEGIDAVAGSVGTVGPEAPALGIG